MARDLYSRLKRLKEYGAGPGRSSEDGGAARPETPPAPAGQNARTGNSNPHPAPMNDDALARVLSEWTRVAPLVYSRTTVVDVDGPPDSEVPSRLLGRDLALRELCFMDTETSGLSGGAGTSVFLVGSGFFERGSVTVTQAFLADFPAEPEFLNLVRELLWNSQVWVSYNGKSFDARLLETRFLMNGQQVVLPEQLDLLYWARRLWRSRIGSCSLGSVESEVLGCGRVDDIDSFEIPERYFQFLRSGDPAGLEAVFSHHLLDIVSLVRLYFRLEEILRMVAGRKGPTSALGVDRVQLGRYLAERGHEDGERLLADAIATPVAGETLRERERAADSLARSRRRAGRADEMLDYWRILWAEGSVHAGVEVAKHLEHRTGDLDAALELTSEILERDLERGSRADITRRLERLRRKSGR